MAYTFLSLYFSIVAIGNMDAASYEAWLVASIMSIAAAVESKDSGELLDLAKKFNALAELAITKNRAR